MSKPHKSNEKCKILLTESERRELQEILRKQSVGAAKLRNARILLMSDADARGLESNPDWYIAQVVGLSTGQVGRIRRRCVQQGVSACLSRKKRELPPHQPKIDGAAEAQLIALCCSEPPEGYQRWTLQLLADELGRLKVVASVCPETVRKSLKKIASSRGRRSGFAFPNGTGRDSWPIWRRP